MRGVAPAAIALAALFLAPAPAAGEAPPAEIPTSVFAARSPFGADPQLSPDGKRIAYSYEKGERTLIGVIDIDRGQVERTIPLGEDQYLRSFSWAGPDKLLLGINLGIRTQTIEGRVSRLFVFDLASGASYYVGPRVQGQFGDKVLYADPGGSFVEIAVAPRLFLEPEVWRFRLDGTDSKGQKLAAKHDVWQWFTDNAGTVRLGLGFQNGRYRVWYRKSADDDFALIAKVNRDNEEELWRGVGILAGSDEGLTFAPGEGGRTALRKYNFATREIGDVVYENPEWNISGVMTDDDGAAMAVHLTDDVDKVFWLYPEYARLQADLAKALGPGETRIIDTSYDKSRLLVWHGGAYEPGSWYVYSKGTKRLAEFSRLRPDLDPALLAPTRPIDYTARDETKIRAYLTLPRGREAKALPLIVMPHGGPYGVRDKIAYVDEVQLLANRGYAVLQPNYRGSDGFGEAFEELGKGQIGRAMQDDLDDAMDWAVAQGIADPARACLVGESYGGYAAIWGAIRNPDRWRCAASFAGVMDWDKQLSYSVDFLDRSDRPQWRERVRGEDRAFELDSVSPASQAARLARPVLIAQGRLDKTVPFSQYLAIKNALEKVDSRQAEYLVIEGAAHGFSEPADEQAWYDALVAFLKKHNPAD